MPFWFELGSIHFVEKVDHRIPVDPGAKNKTKTIPRYESRKMVLKLELGSRLD